ncbi:MAG: ATP-binding protein [Planctomycetia bacterium]|nr:MAG: ATP-binding protein [Planctomycetia bacterium]
MAVSFATFVRLKDKGLAALRAGDAATARPFLLQAADCMIEIAASNPDAKRRTEQEQYARELLELAKECDRRGAGGVRPRDRAREGDESQGADASDWIVREKPNIRFDDIAGLDDVKQELRLKMLYPFAHPELARHYGVGAGGGVLLYGPPGTGKTMMARAVATELDATMFVITPAQLMSKWVGEAEQNVRKLFDAARGEARCVIFIDEIEALVPARRDVDSSVMQRVVPQILQEIDGFERKGERALLFLGATNEPWTLDPAMMRPGRFDVKILIPLPDPPARFRLFEIHLSKRPLADDVDFAALVEVSEGYSGADVAAVCARAASAVFLESVQRGSEARPIAMSDLVEALSRTPPSVSPADADRFARWAGGLN